jgi:hypothetical protein
MAAWSRGFIDFSLVSQVILSTDFQKSLLNKLGEGTEIPVQAWTGLESSRRLRFPDFKTVGT